MAAENRERANRRRRALTLKVSGPGVRPGRIPIPELVKICEHAQAAVNRQADAIVGKNSKRPGPKTGDVREHCTLELASLRRGSATLGFDPLRAQQSFLDSALGQQAIAGVALAVEALETGSDYQIDPGVLESLAGLGDALNGRVKSITWTVPFQHGRRKQVVATFNEKVKTRIAERLSPPTLKPSPIELVGMLEMADFKPSDFKCRLKPSVGPTYLCSFDEALAGRVQAALRKLSKVTGLATVDPNTNRPENIHLSEVVQLSAAMPASSAFFAGLSLAELAELQGVKPIRDIRELASDVIPDDVDIDADLEAIYLRRE